MPDVGTGISAAASIGGGLLGASASKSAAKSQAQSSAAAIKEERRQYDQTRQDTQFARNVGNDALKNLWARTSGGGLLQPFGMDQFQADPGYQFRLGEGSKAIERSAAARGMQLSGATLKALQRFNQDFASNEYGNAWNRDNAEKMRTYNTLAGLSGIGQQANNVAIGAGMQSANNVANLITGQGNANAAGQVGSANAIAGGLSDAASAFQFQQLMNRLAPPPTSTPAGSGFTQLSALGGSANSLFRPRIA